MQALQQSQNEIVSKMNNLMTNWLKDTNQSFTDMCMKELGAPYRSTPFWAISDNVELGDKVEGDITLITQFFISDIPERNEELTTSLHVNIANKHIDKIILLNERIYTNEELGTNSNKIEQIVVNKRLDYKTVFDEVDKLNLSGYIVLSNLDIFFDKTIEDVKRSNIANEKALFALVRYEYNPGVSVANSPLFYHKSDSQDTWIWHSNYNLKEKERSIFDFPLGKPGCDNTFMYLAQMLGFKTYNLPNLIKTYHNHSTNKRNYDAKSEKTLRPYYNMTAITNDSVKQDISHPFTFHGENKNFYDYLTKMFSENKHFIIPRLAGIEHLYAVTGAIAKTKRQFDQQQAAYINKTRKVMKNNAGILLNDGNSIIQYSDLYLRAFHLCDMYLDWEPQGDVAAGGLQPSFEFIQMNFPDKKRAWSFGVADIFHLIHQEKPWTHALRGKRLLIISPFGETFKKQLPVLDKIYGRDLFPDCSFVFLKPPTTNGQNHSRPFVDELNDFVKQIGTMKDEFDVALLSCGGYGNPAINRIHDMGKSAIYIGGVLQMYFGVYGSRWERERPLMMKLFKNKHWVRPTSDERPKGFENVEGSCYW